MSQYLICLSLEPHAIVYSTGLIAIEDIGDCRSFICCVFLPVLHSHILTYASWLPEAITLPSIDISTHVMGFEWLFKVCTLFFFLRSHNLRFVSQEPLTNNCPPIVLWVAKQLHSDRCSLKFMTTFWVSMSHTTMVPALEPANTYCSSKLKHALTTSELKPLYYYDMGGA